MKKLFLSGIACIFFAAVNAQEIKPTDSIQLAKVGIAPFNMSIPEDSLTIQNITEQQFAGLLSKSNKQLKFVVIYTPYCSGTPSMLNYVNEVRTKYPDKVDVLLLSSENIKQTGEVFKALNTGSVHMKTYMIDKQYKEARSDNRQKGFNFRNKICTECASDIIGVPYCLLYDAENKIIFHGYRGYKNTLPSDIVTYFLEGKSEQK